MSHWVLGVALVGLLEAAQLNLDCARPTAARRLIGQVKLSEIEWAEDVNRAAMWDAFGRCAELPEPETCRNQERRRFEADLDRQRAVIEAKYRKMLEEFEQRCQASITRRGLRPPAEPPPEISLRRPSRRSILGERASTAPSQALPQNRLRRPKRRSKCGKITPGELECP